MSHIETDNLPNNNTKPTFIMLTGVAESGKSKIVDILREKGVLPEDYQVRELGDELLVYLQKNGDTN